MDGPHDLEAIYRDHARKLWRSLFAYTGGRRELADDALAEAFARALANADQIRDPLPWLYRVAFRIAATEMKRGGGDEMREAIAEPPGDSVPAVLAALRHLSPAQRATVYLHYQADQSVAEVASILGMSTAAVKVHLFRGRVRLRALLGEESDDE